MGVRRTLAVLAAVAVVPLYVGSTAADASMPARHLVTHSSRDTLNWAGYVDAPPSGTRVTAVATSFIVPTISSDFPPGISSTWAGIGGSTTDDLIQAGVAENSPPTPLTGPLYEAWYELLPDYETPLTNCRGNKDCSVNGGDHMQVSITQTGANLWHIHMTDVGHWTWDKTVRYASSGSSAEWIAEASAILGQPMTYGDLTTTQFTYGAFAVGRKHYPIRAHNSEIDTMTLLGIAPREATPSALNRSGTAFNVCAYSTSCAAPR
jgi:hypothetical protein